MGGGGVGGWGGGLNLSAAQSSRFALCTESRTQDVSLHPFDTKESVPSLFIHLLFSLSLSLSHTHTLTLSLFLSLPPPVPPFPPHPPTPNPHCLFFVPPPLRKKRRLHACRSHRRGKGDYLWRKVILMASTRRLDQSAEGVSRSEQFTPIS